MRQSFLPFALPDVDDQELLEIKEALASGWVTTGPKTKQFETEFAAAVGAKHAVAVNSCTAAMHLALEAAGLQQGDEVITTSYTFAATAEVVRYFDARPVLVDVRSDDFNIDVHQIEAAITGRTRAIMPVHVAGLPADMDAIYAIAEQHNLAVIEDAAHAYPAMYHGRMIGQQMCPGVRSAVCFSFYATKPITTGEGGMICTDDEALADRCRMMALHGMSRDAWKRYTAEGSWHYEIIAPGFKYNMADVAAAMGLAQLRKAERMWRRRTAIAHRYDAAFGTQPQLETPHDRPDCQHAWHLYMLRLNLNRLSIDSARFIEELKARRIGASVHYIPLHVHPYYQDTYRFFPQDLPTAFAQYLREVSLPIYSRMSDQDVEDTVSAVLDIVDSYHT